MKTGTFLTMLAAVGLLCSTSITATAQGGGGGGGFGGGRRGGLTQEQNQQIRDALQDSSEMTALTEKLNAAQQEAIDAALAKDATEASVRAKVEAVAKIQTDIAMLRYTKAVKAVVPSITDEQKTQMKEIPFLGYNQLFGGGFGGRGGRRGGRGGGGGGDN
jgi:Spy/CpxP family protein refolding chaperone